ncbi:MAG: helix-turn-helix domain-containing protein [Gammaproteobacteria bacterium]
METIRASGLPGRARAAAWNALYSARLDQVDVTPADHDTFDAELTLGNLGPIRVARITCGRSSIARTPRHIVHAPGRVFSFILQARGNGVFAQYGNEASLKEGDITLCDSAAPHSYHVEDSSEMMMLRVPASLLKERLPSPEQFCGRHLSSTQGLACTVAAVMASLCTQLERGLTPYFQNSLARHLLDLLATSYAMAFDSLTTASSVVSGRHAKVKLYIEQRLRDPELSPCMIALGLKLSSRYLRMIFATSSETVSAYILRRRLEECARQMSDPQWRGRSIAEIAFGWGFNSAPHFTRSFRDRYGLSPRHYRFQQLASATQELPPRAQPTRRATAAMNTALVAST